MINHRSIHHCLALRPGQLLLLSLSSCVNLQLPWKWRPRSFVAQLANQALDTTGPPPSRDFIHCNQGLPGTGPNLVDILSYNAGSYTNIRCLETATATDLPSFWLVIRREQFDSHNAILTFSSDIKGSVLMLPTPRALIHLRRRWKTSQVSLSCQITTRSLLFKDRSHGLHIRPWTNLVNMARPPLVVPLCASTQPRMARESPT